MTERNNELGDLQQDAAICAENLLRLYSFEVGGYMPDQLLSRWLTLYPIEWVRLAVVEALYQGRYKSISVEQILSFWRRRGEPVPHFNLEFDRMVCSKLPRAMPSRFSSMGTGLSSALSSALSGGRVSKINPTAIPRHRVMPLVVAPLPQSDDLPPDVSLQAAVPPLDLDRAVEHSIKALTDSTLNASAIATTTPPTPPSALKLPYLEPLKPSPLDQSTLNPRATDNLVPLPVRPTAQSIPSSQIGSYNLRTEEGRRQFLETMRSLLSKQHGPKRELPALPEAQALDIAVSSAESSAEPSAEPSAAVAELPAAVPEPEIAPALAQLLLTRPEVTQPEITRSEEGMARLEAGATQPGESQGPPAIADPDHPLSAHPQVTDSQDTGSALAAETLAPELSGAEPSGPVSAEALAAETHPLTMAAPVDLRQPEQFPQTLSEHAPIARFTPTSAGYFSNASHPSNADDPGNADDPSSAAPPHNQAEPSLIHQFTPRTSTSDFYAKLRAVALPDAAAVAPDSATPQVSPDDPDFA
jgi:hypothetical protein